MGKAGRPSVVDKIDIVAFGNNYNQWCHKFISKEQFARNLGITSRTLDTHMEKLYTKMMLMIQSGQLEWVMPENRNTNTEDN